MGTLASDTSLLRHVNLVMRLAQKAWRQCVLVFAHDLRLRGGNCNGSLRTLVFFFFPRVTDTFSSFDANYSLSRLYH